MTQREPLLESMIVREAQRLYQQAMGNHYLTIPVKLDDRVNDPIYKSLCVLRQCAMESGYRGVELACQCSMVRMAGDAVALRLVALIRKKKEGA